MAGLHPPVVNHPFGWRYCGLKIGAMIIRLATLLQTIEVRRLRKALPPDITLRTIEVPSREKGRTIRVDIYEPKQGGKLPVHLNLHGSGYVINGLGSDTEFCAALASRGPTIVLDCDYRKAPEHPFPAALYDAQDVAAWALAHRPDRFIHDGLTLSGFSAGANLAMSLSLLLGKDTIKALCGFYGNYDLTRAPSSPQEECDGGIDIPILVRRFLYHCYLLPGFDRGAKLVSPGLSTPASEFPRHVFLACGRADTLHGSAEALAVRLKEQGHSDVVFLQVDRAAHGFDKRVKQGSLIEREKDRVYAAAIEMARKV